MAERPAPTQAVLQVDQQVIEPDFNQRIHNAANWGNGKPPRLGAPQHGRQRPLLAHAPTVDGYPFAR